MLRIMKLTASAISSSCFSFSSLSYPCSCFYLLFLLLLRLLPSSSELLPLFSSLFILPNLSLLLLLSSSLEMTTGAAPSLSPVKNEAASLLFLLRPSRDLDLLRSFFFFFFLSFFAFFASFFLFFKFLFHLISPQGCNWCVGLVLRI